MAMRLSQYIRAKGLYFGVLFDVILILERMLLGRAVMPDGPGWLAAELLFKGVFSGFFMGVFSWFTFERRRVRRN
jgi:hypothetical protein